LIHNILPEIVSISDLIQNEFVYEDQIEGKNMDRMQPVFCSNVSDLSLDMHLEQQKEKFLVTINNDLIGDSMKHHLNDQQILNKLNHKNDNAPDNVMVLNYSLFHVQQISVKNCSVDEYFEKCLEILGQSVEQKILEIPCNSQSNSITLTNNLVLHEFGCQLFKIQPTNDPVSFQPLYDFGRKLAEKLKAYVKVEFLMANSSFVFPFVEVQNEFAVNTILVEQTRSRWE